MILIGTRSCEGSKGANRRCASPECIEHLSCHITFLTQEQLALAVEVERNFVSLIERGVNQPSIRVIFKLGDALGVPPSKMMKLVEALIKSD